MTACCTPSPGTEGTNKFFSKQAARYVKKFRKKGLAKEQGYLIEGILSAGISGTSVLEIGCGVGGVHLTLLNHGASSATGIDIAEGMLNGAKELAREMNLGDRAKYYSGDFAQIAGDVHEADVVILDKVVCCYEDVRGLVAKSTGKAKRVYALSFPRSTPLSAFLIKTAMLLGKILKWSFHPYWHDWDAMVREIRENGFERRFYRNTLMWDVFVFERTRP